MLRLVNIQNFKCFRESVQIEVGQINLLTGINGRGKSTALQTLLLMNQSLEHSQTTSNLLFNGNCVELGDFEDVRNAETSQSDNISLQFRFQEDDDYLDLHYYFGENESDEMSAQIHGAKLIGSVDNNITELEVKYISGEYTLDPAGQKLLAYWQNFLFTRNEFSHPLLAFAHRVVDFSRIHYISADRLGPQDFYLKQSFTDFPNVGPKGEYAANILYRMQNDLVAEGLCLDIGETFTLLDQTQAWLQLIFDGARIELKPTEANIVLMSLNSENSTLTQMRL